MPQSGRKSRPKPRTRRLDTYRYARITWPPERIGKGLPNGNAFKCFGQAARNGSELVEIGPKTVKTPAVSQPNLAGCG